MLLLATLQECNARVYGCYLRSVGTDVLLGMQSYQALRNTLYLANFSWLCPKIATFVFGLVLMVEDKSETAWA